MDAASSVYATATAQASFGGSAPSELQVTVGATSIAFGDRQMRLTDIDALDVRDYRIVLTGYDRSVVTLSMLGPSLDVIAAAIRLARDEALLSDLALVGVAVVDDYPAVLVTDGEEYPVTVRLFSDCLAVLPTDGGSAGGPFGVPYAFLEKVAWDADAYRLTLTDDLERVIVLGKLAKRSEEFIDELSRLRSAHRSAFASALSAFVPAAAPLADVMEDGHAMSVVGVESRAAGAWTALVDAVCSGAETRGCYDYLCSLLPEESPALGLKMSVGDPLDAQTWLRWFFVPVARRTDHRVLVAQEVTSGSGFATYLFELQGDTGRGGGAGGDMVRSEVAGSEGAAPASAALGLKSLNRALVQLNFRREPLYLSEEVMQGEEYARYRVALRSLAYLRDARRAFVGRVVHSDSWQKAIESAIEEWSAGSV